MDAKITGSYYFDDKKVIFTDDNDNPIKVECENIKFLDDSKHEIVENYHNCYHPDWNDLMNLFKEKSISEECYFAYILFILRIIDDGVLKKKPFIHFC